MNKRVKLISGGKRFLLVEDNALNREIAMEMLESVGAVVESACDGAEGAAKFAAEPAGYYDLLLMDVADACDERL